MEDKCNTQPFHVFVFDLETPRPSAVFFLFIFHLPLQLDPSEALTYWAEKGRHAFPLLAPVAQQTFGNPAAASQVERDFSGCGNLIVPNGNRIDTYWMEMVMFLKANYRSIPTYNAIPEIAPGDIQKSLPAWFNGDDQGLLDAAAAMDLLVNNEPPPGGGMDLS